MRGSELWSYKPWTALDTCIVQGLAQTPVAAPLSPCTPDLLIAPLAAACSALALHDVTGLAQGSAPADWFFIPCGPFVTAGIRLDLHPGGWEGGGGW